jgi:hypothetical protein
MTTQTTPSFTIAQLLEELLASYKSIDRDNMEFSSTITCYQHDRLILAVRWSKELEAL